MIYNGFTLVKIFVREGRPISRNALRNFSFDETRGFREESKRTPNLSFYPGPSKGKYGLLLNVG